MYPSPVIVVAANQSYEFSISGRHINNYFLILKLFLVTTLVTAVAADQA
jgi:hypothetical protein